MISLSLYFLLLCTLLITVNSASWSKDEFKNPDGTTYQIAGPTVIKQGPDLRYYIGGAGRVTALSVDENYVVNSTCVSTDIEDNRIVLGMTFSPLYFKTDDIVLFVSTSILNFGGGPAAAYDQTTYDWANGRVDVIRTNIGTSCLAKVGSIVTGLPVSNSNHGVNGLDINFDGNLLISNGGTTNAGVAEQGDLAGGYPETPLSGAVLEAQILKDGYNGDVLYSLPDGRNTDIINSPDIQYYATGFRNAFGIEVHSSAGVFLVDNGPNSGYGKQSTGCTTQLGTQPAYEDKFLRLNRSGWYGHPNRNRGRYDVRQCTYEHLGIAEGNTFKELSAIESSTNGIAEFSSAVQGSDFKHAMIFARFGFDSKGSSFAFTLDQGGNAITGREEIFTDEGGLDVIMDKNANLILTEYMGSRIKVFKSEPEEFSEFSNNSIGLISVFPNRGPPAGGNIVYVTVKLPLNANVMNIYFGTTIVSILERIGHNTFSVLVPPGSPMLHVHVTVNIDGVSSAHTGNGDYRYMEESTNVPFPQWILDMNSTT